MSDLDFIVAVDRIERLPQLDPNRLAPFGFGAHDGYNAIFETAQLAIRGQNGADQGNDALVASRTNTRLQEIIDTAIRTAAERARYAVSEDPNV
jgi:hypothetical protein